MTSFLGRLRGPFKRPSPPATDITGLHATETSVSRQGDQIAVTWPMTDGRSLTVQLDDDTASQLGGALVGMAGATAPTGSLFEMVPFLTIWNPPFELQRSDAGQVVIGFKPRDHRPVIVQLERAEARQLRDLLDGALR